MQENLLVREQDPAVADSGAIREVHCPVLVPAIDGKLDFGFGGCKFVRLVQDEEIRTELRYRQRESVYPKPYADLG